MSEASAQPTSSSSTAAAAAEDQEPQQHEPPLSLPASGEQATTKIDLSDGSGTVKLDHLGPMVVNSDGTLSRIANWDQMTEIERRNTLRVLGKRNKLRMAELGAEEKKPEGN